MGIKSFQGARKATQQNNNNTQSNFKVSDFMSRELITFKATQSVEEVVSALIKHKISGGPVVNERNELIGIISEGDCIKQISDSRYYNMPMENDSIEKHMVTNVETIDGNLNVFDAAKQFLDSKRRRFPIVEDGKLVGQISQKDILKAAMQLKQQNWK
ncbi:CBS domain-containing protein [Lacinutrix sp. 5H-3-7-4]|uniref:CBS domain-containing protein n=1 Tax=Lacinutrix sp. (strain 5H-3-7-4) TaxID=983544 RepID=UPI00020A3CD7|nr:CBS domain-containing protein [Lacinutrix sp. 5H-3-7-4]AEH01008.1 CBS domain containing membrane protein [Lacinutrix sp. 5H-3-7-4]